jgi:hypothetical protein
VSQQAKQVKFDVGFPVPAGANPGLSLFLDAPAEGGLQNKRGGRSPVAKAAPIALVSRVSITAG